MAWKRLAKTSEWPTTDGGHYANQNGGAMENFANYTPDTATPLLAPVDITFTVPNVANPKVLFMIGCDMFTNASGNTEHGWFDLADNGTALTGSRKRVTSSGPNHKRRINYSHVVTDLAAGATKTITWRWEAVNADDVRANAANDGLTRMVLEAWDVS